jgi:two-component system sensor histidine kinase/response regulator
MTEQKNLKSNRVLIVDDNARNLQVLGSTLKQNKYEVEFALNGKSALQWIADEKFDIILLDIMMPDLDGYETCVRIRKNKKYDEIPILFLTAKTDKESVIKGFKVGGQDYITKPFDSEELLARVNTHLELKNSREKLANMNKILEAKVAERTKELSRANEELSQLDVVKVQFLNMLSHEIRTPLNGIKGSIHLLKSRIEKADLVQFLNILDLSVIRLEKFSYSALLITRLNSKKYKLNLSPIFFTDQIEYCLLDLSKDESLSKNISVDYDNINNKISFNADKDLLHELLLRVFENAIIYSGENINIKLSLFEENKYIQIHVEDSGPGFPEKILKENIKMFNPGEKHVNKNMGLNLYLVKLILEYHGGRLELDNHSKGGARVKMFFPK